MTRQMATMVSSGLTILRALYILEAQTDSKPLAEALVKVRKDVEAGCRSPTRSSATRRSSTRSTSP
jgi:type II secretory pathway component PulF